MVAIEKTKTVNLRLASIAMAVVLGSALAFLLGARAGASLDHKTRTVTVAHTPVPPVAVANK